ncbi:MAG: right-handed parallel beta-helix repeat-containing protein [Verrucomicrobiota bacterium]
MPVDEIKSAILASPDLRVFSGLNLKDKTDGLQRWITTFPKMAAIPGPLTEDFPSDQHTLSFFRVNYLIIEDSRIEASVVEEALKFSDCHYVWVRNSVLLGGHEDALDVVRGSHLIFENVEFISRGARAVTIKGGVDTVYFLDCHFSGSAKAGAFIELGDWTDYDKNDHPPTSNIVVPEGNTFDCPTIVVRRGSSRRYHTSQTIRPIRTYYIEAVEASSRVERLPSWMMSIYFGIQDLVK